MESRYHEGSRRLQERFDTVRLADRIEERRMRETIDDGDRAFIESADMFFLATADADGRPQCSYKGGDPGFVRVVDERTIAFPSWDGNGMYLSAGNVLVNPQVGLLFIDFERRSRLRLNGVFPNCPRYIHQYQLIERSRFTPHEESATPAPAWKRLDWSRDVLPAGDPALDPDAEIL
jgi:predicted pyridoxine 5'-phosphate oxidase superfamily flavin-nucleotide-binding protein